MIDNNPALNGPPSQTISGVTNKSPAVDSPNLKLQSQDAKQLDADAAKTSALKVKNSSNKSKDVNVVGSVDSTNKKSSYKSDGVGKNWSPNKYDPKSISGNTKYVDPKTGKVGTVAETPIINNKSVESTKTVVSNPTIPKPPTGPRIKIVKIGRSPLSTNSLNLP